MSVFLDPNKTPCVIGLVGEVDIRCATELKEALVEALALGRGLRLDIKGVTKVDITALQLWWAAEREARRTSQEFMLDGAMTDATVAAVKCAGLTLPLGAV